MNTEIDNITRGRVLLEFGWIDEAERETLHVLESHPDNIDALSLFAKIKHVRGELSEAIAGWAQIHVLTPHSESLKAQLESLLHRARCSDIDGRLDAEVVPMSVAQRELERAFALLHDHQPERARATCDALAERCHRDPQVYKLAAIASAWIAELSGELGVARARLEQLGREQGFEYDLDRLFALASIYEQLDTVELNEAAIRVYRHILTDLERQGMVSTSLLGKLAALERRAGKIEIAADLEARFLEGVRRRMHRPTLEEVARVAASEYLPLTRLRQMRDVEGELPELPRRERALVHALRGHTGHARVMLAEGRDALDQLYLADLSAIDGDDSRAIELLVRALEDSPENLHAIGRMLEHHARRPSALITHYWSKPERRTRALAMLEQARECAPAQPDAWHHLATLHDIAGNRETARACSTRARVLAEASLARARPIGRAFAASVYHFVGKAKGLVHEISVHREPVERGTGGTLALDDIFGNITPELRGAIRSTFLSVREYARAKFPHATTAIDDFKYSYKLPKEDEASSGMSAGLPSALAILSVLIQLPIPRAIASSGALISEAHDVITIGRVGEVELKVKAAYHGNLTRLILPLANRPELEQSTGVPREIINDVVRYAADLDQAIKLVFGADVFTLV